MSNRYRSREEPEADKSNSWLLTYSDMVTLCLTFFVLLYSFSTIDAVKWKSLINSLQGALGVMDGSNVPNTTNEENRYDTIDQIRIDQYLAYEEETKRMEKIQARLNEYLSSNNLNENISTSIEERGVIIRFQDSILFPKGSAALYQESAIVLSGLSAIFAELKSPIRIEGHTDNLAINTEQFPSNWELSTARATKVLRFLIKDGVPGEQLSAVGYGEFRPIAVNDCEENRKKNRRVDIVLIRESLVISEPK
ncbi:MAG: OmpA family protein [Bacilli bacterium]|nr:OmpA family protein [Clostridia bacterium]